MLTKQADWKKDQTLHWKNTLYKRNSQEYSDLIKRAFETKFQASEIFRDALKSTKGYTLTHKCGNNNPEETVLTEEEFINQLNMLRDKL